MAVQEGSGAREKGEDEATPVSCLGVAAASFLRLQVCMSLSHPDLTCLRGSQELHLPLAAPTHHSSQPCTSLTGGHLSPQRDFNPTEHQDSIIGFFIAPSLAPFRMEHTLVLTVWLPLTGFLE